MVEGASERIEVPHLERWWLVRPDDLADLADPDVEDGHQRHADRDLIDWGSIGDTVSAVWRQLNAAQALSGGARDDSQSLSGWADLDESSLGAVEIHIVRSWFSDDEAPRCDAWDDDVDDGRHRLWNVWASRPGLELPVASPTLESLDDGPDNLEALCAGTRDGLAHASQDVLQRNKRYAGELRRVEALAAPPDDEFIFERPSWRSQATRVTRPQVRFRLQFPTRVVVVDGDLLEQDVDALVNPWNRNLVRPHWALPMRGVSRALKRATGPQPWRELASVGRLPVGAAVVTHAGLMSDDLFLVHAVGLNAWWRANEDSVRKASMTAVTAAWAAGARSVAMPLIGAGQGGLSDEDSLYVMREALTVNARRDDDALPLKIRIVRWSPS